MCGICGFCFSNDYAGKASRDTLTRMTELLSRRGPDGSGVFHRVYPGGGNKPPAVVGLGHRRLAIIDLVTGDQPIANEDETVFVIANGEIYNFRELRASLEESGHVFRTKTDIEVIVHLYEEKGLDFINDLNGMFALALWDGKRRRLALARDRFGIKPLHFIKSENGIAFASEIKSLLSLPWVESELNYAGLDRYLALEYVPAPHTMFRGIEKLPASHMLVREGSEVREKRYWSLPHREPEEIGESTAVDEIRSRLRQAVSRRLVADVPVGVFLSGGIDSSLVAAFASGESDGVIPTFSIGFRDTSFDESSYARLAAETLGTAHNDKLCTPDDMREIIPHLYDFLDEPFADASVIPTALLSAFAGEEVKVVLGGDGGDELFAGYPTYQAHRLAALAKRLPGVVKERLLPAIVKRLPTSLANISFDFKLKRFMRGLPLEPVERNVAWLGAFTAPERKKLLTGASLDLLGDSDPMRELEAFADDCPQDDDLARMLYLDLRTYLADDILVKVDRASMAHSLEVRTPFLDHEFVEYVWSLPLAYRLSGLTTKYILKEAARGILPNEIIDRPKKGFGIPVGRWLFNEMRHMLEKYLSPDRIQSEGIFEARVVSRYVDDHLARRRDCRKELWTLLNFGMWLEKYRPRV
jgi:asparagine synthase (glutamine-hydrolysing)